MKKFLALALVLILALSMVACNNAAAPGEIKTMEDLQDRKIGVQTGTTGDIYISGDVDDGAFGKAKVERFNKGFEAVQALAQGKVDAVIIDDQPAKTFVASDATLTILDTPYALEDYALAIAKDNTELQEQINAAIKELKAEGVVKNILDYYIGGVEGAAPYTSPEGITYDGKLVMATNAEFPPYEYHETDASGNDVIAGLDVDFARAICDKLGKELVIEDMAFDSILTAVQGGKADFAAAGLTVNEERLKSVAFSETYCTGVQVVIVKK